MHQCLRMIVLWMMSIASSTLLQGTGISPPADCVCLGVDLTKLKQLQVNLSQTQKFLEDYGQKLQEDNAQYVNVSRSMAKAETDIMERIAEADKERYLLSVQGSDLAPIDSLLQSLNEQLSLLKTQNYERLDFETRKLRSTTELVDNLREQMRELERLERLQRRSLRRTAGGQISISNSHRCLLGRNGKLTCWGKNDYRQSEVPDYLLNATIWQVSTGDGHTCVIASDIPSNLEIGQQANREIRCWGNNIFGKSSPPKLQNVSYVSLGGAHGCALYTSSQEAVDQSFGLPAGKIACWGWNATGQLYAPSDLSFKEVSCGFSHTCALNSIGKIFCWGNPAEGRIDSPAGLGFHGISAGHAHTCAIDQQGQPVCWGSQEMTEGISLSQIRRDSTTETISCGSGHTCAISSVGRLTCFGKGSARLYSNAQGSTGSSAPLRKVDCVQAGCGGWTLACEKMLQRHDTSCMVNATAQLAPTVPLLFVHVGLNAACGADRVSGRVICWGDIDRDLPISDGTQKNATGLAPENAEVCTGWPWE